MWSHSKSFCFCRKPIFDLLKLLKPYVEFLFHLFTMISVYDWNKLTDSLWLNRFKKFESFNRALLVSLSSLLKLSFAFLYISSTYTRALSCKLLWSKSDLSTSVTFISSSQSALLQPLVSHAPTFSNFMQCRNS